MAKKEACLDERVRAEDILLGSLGFDTDARIIEIEVTSAGYKGKGQWSDGEIFCFESENDVSSLEQWAVSVLSRREGSPV
jgi:hypothetical protein